MRRQILLAVFAAAALTAGGALADEASQADETSQVDAAAVAQTHSAPAPATFIDAPAPRLPSSSVGAAATPVLPIFAQGPTFARGQASGRTAASAQGTAPDPWAGLTLGGGVSVVGGKGLKGGIGGFGYLAYDKELSNHVTIGVQGVSGYSPTLLKSSPFSGVDYGGMNVRVGYDLGQVEPYVFAGVGIAKLDTGPAGRYSTTDSLNSLLNKGNGPSFTTTTVGAGVNYAVTNNFSMGFSVSVTQANGSGVVFPTPVVP